MKSVSVMATRLYSEDVTANGFLLANTIKSKSDVEAVGEVRGAQLKGDTVKGRVIEAEEKISTLNLVVGAGLEAGGIECKKLTVGDIDMGEKFIEVVNVVNSLVAQINDLKAELELFKSTSGEGGGGGGGAAAVEAN